MRALAFALSLALGIACSAQAAGSSGVAGRRRRCSGGGAVAGADSGADGGRRQAGHDVGARRPRVGDVHVGERLRRQAAGGPAPRGGGAARVRAQPRGSAGGVAGEQPMFKGMEAQPYGRDPEAGDAGHLLLRRRVARARARRFPARRGFGVVPDARRRSARPSSPTPRRFRAAAPGRFHGMAGRSRARDDRRRFSGGAGREHLGAVPPRGVGSVRVAVGRRKRAVHLLPWAGRVRAAAVDRGRLRRRDQRPQPIHAGEPGGVPAARPRRRRRDRRRWDRSRAAPA